MARQVLPWVGAAVGGYFGGPQGAQIGFAIGSAVGNAVDPQVINGPSLGDGVENNVSEGGFRPIVHGRGQVGTTLIHQGPRVIRVLRHRQSKGTGAITTEERALQTLAFGLGESAYPDKGVKLTRLWVGGKLVYDVTLESQIPAESDEFATTFTFYDGNETQLPDPDIEAFLGLGNVPSYRGGCPYIVFPLYDVTDTGGTAPVVTAELVSEGTTASGWALTIANAGGDVGYGHKVWVSADLNGWEGPYDRVGPVLDYPTYGPVAVGGGLLIAGAGGVVEQSEDIDFTDGLQVTAQSIGATSIGRIRGFGDIAIAMQVSGSTNKYWTRETPDSEWIEQTSPSNPSNGGFQDIARLQNRRWVGVLSDGPGTRFLYSDDDGPPVHWYDTLSVGGNIASTGGAIACNGKVAAYMGTLGRVAVTVSGSSWSHVYTLPLPSANGGRDAAQSNGGNLVLSYEGGNAGVVIGNESGSSWEYANNPTPGFQVQRLASNGHGTIVASFPSAGDDRAAAVSRQGGAPGTWIELQVPAYGLERRPRIEYWQTAITGEKVQLGGIVSWLHDRVGANAYNVTELSDQVEGIVLSGSYTAGDAIRTLGGVYFFDAGEYDAGSGYCVNYVKRGKPAVATISEDDVVEGPDDWVREDSLTRPRTLHVSYPNPIADYGAPNIVVKRTSPDVLVVGERSISVPVVFSDATEITRRADIMMTIIYSEIAGTYEITLPDSWLSLAPTDTIGYSIRGRTRRLRLQEWRYIDGVIKTEWMADRQSAVTSNVTGLPPVRPTRPPPSLVGSTVSAVLDVPALIDSADDLHLLVAASGQSDAWYGADHQRKLPAETDFTTALRITGTTTIMGTLQSVVTAASEHYTDTTNVVRVRLYSDDELITHTQDQFLTENGAFALAWFDGGVRRWEIMQYRDAVKIGDRDWELSTLLRGRLCTATAEHQEGVMFVLLDSGLHSMTTHSAWIGRDITHRAVSLGQHPEAATPYTELYTGQSQVEFPVAHVMGEIDGDTLRVQIVPRHRFGTDDNPVRSINWAGYRITVTDGAATWNVETPDDSREFDITDFARPITVTVSQLNRFTGAGPAVSEEFA